MPNGCASADDLSWALRAGISKRLAVTSALRGLLKRDNHGNPDVSEWIARVPPRDRWDSATWFIRPKARQWLKDQAAFLDQREVSNPQ